MSSKVKDKDNEELKEKIADDRAYSAGHLWLRLEAEPVVLGVSAPLVERLGALIAVELPLPDEEMMLDVPFGEVEGTKEVCQLYPPADAVVLEVNEAVLWDVERVSRDPYGKGWLLKIRVHEPDQLRNLMTAEAYQQQCEHELAKKQEDDQ